MVTSRRSFFQILTAAFAAPAVTRAIAPPTRAPIKSMVALAREAELERAVLLSREVEPLLVKITASELAHSSMRMLGVLAAGECLAAQEMEACLVVLRMLHPVRHASDLIAVPGERMLWLRFDLAAEMAPEFGVQDFRQRCGWSYGPQ